MIPKLIYIAAAIFVVFALLPSLVMTWFAFSRRNPKDFDARLDLFETEKYAPYKERILRDMADMRKLPFKTVCIESDDGIPLRGEWLDLGQKRTAILLHGYCSTPANNFCSLLHYFRESGWNVLMIYQRAHGKSGGKATTFGLRERYDLVNWLDWAAKTTGGSPVLLYGISMGGATVAAASRLIQETNVRACVIDAGYDSPCEQFKHQCIVRHAPWRIVLPLVSLFAGLLLKADVREDFADALAESRIPTLFIYQTGDTSVPVACGRHCYENCGAPKQWLEIEKGGPHAMAFISGGDVVRQTLTDFVKEQDWSV